jgi:hypothetical protein
MDSVSFTAMKLFGVTQRSVVGDTLSSLFPQPFAAYPQRLLDMCAATHNDSASKLVLCRHRMGHTFPVYLAVNELGRGLSMCLFQQMAGVPDDFILFKSDDYRILGMSQESMAMTGVSSFLITSLPIMVSA